MDDDGSGHITFNEFSRAVNGEPKNKGFFAKGDAVQYFSTSYKDWIDAEIIEEFQGCFAL